MGTALHFCIHLYLAESIRCDFIIACLMFPCFSKRYSNACLLYFPVEALWTRLPAFRSRFRQDVHHMHPTNALKTFSQARNWTKQLPCFKPALKGSPLIKLQQYAFLWETKFPESPSGHFSVFSSRPSCYMQSMRHLFFH